MFQIIPSYTVTAKIAPIAPSEGDEETVECCFRVSDTDLLSFTRVLTHNQCPSYTVSRNPDFGIGQTEDPQE